MSLFYIWSAYVLLILLDTLSLDIKASNLIKYSIIVVLFLDSAISLLNKRKQKKEFPQTSFVTIALFFAVCADYFLLFTNWLPIGILCFIAVQYIYKNILDLKIEKTLNRINYKSIFFFVILQCILFILFQRNFLYIVAGEYACFLLRNTFICWWHKQKTGLPISMAITFLFLCDCNVLLANVTEYPIFWRLIWIFYVPSQFILEKYVSI